jgi:hypothetical protein
MLHVWNIFLHDWAMFGVNVGQYSIHGASGMVCVSVVSQSQSTSEAFRVYGRSASQLPYEYDSRPVKLNCIHPDVCPCIYVYPISWLFLHAVVGLTSNSSMFLVASTSNSSMFFLVLQAILVSKRSKTYKAVSRTERCWFHGLSKHWVCPESTIKLNFPHQKKSIKWENAAFSDAPNEHILSWLTEPFYHD